MGNRHPLFIEWLSPNNTEDGIEIKVRIKWPEDVDPNDRIPQKEIKEYLNKKVGNYDIEKGWVKTTLNSDTSALVFFDINKWIKYNFYKEPKVNYKPLRTLEFKCKRRVPDCVTSHVNWSDINKKIEKHFKSFVRENKKSLFKEKMKILKAINFNWFIFKSDLKNDIISVKLKASVMGAVLIAGSQIKKVS